MSGASAIATNKITNGSMIGQFGRAATRPRTQIILPLDLSPYNPSMKLGFSAPALRNGSKTLGARRLFSGCPWDSSQARDDFDLFPSRVFFRSRDCEFVPINPDHALEFVEQRFCKKSCAAISIDQQLLIGRNEIDN